MKQFEPIPEELNQLTNEIVDAAFRVHSALGPGLLESIYETCMEYELKKRGFSVERQVALPVVYDGVQLEAGVRLDLLVENTVIVELKAAEQMLPLFEAQLLTYLKLAKLRLGLLINFNVPVIKDGIKRIIL